VRASELVGAIEFAEGLKRGGEGTEKPLASLESAASDFQLALRSNPTDPRMNRNLTRAMDRLPELREQAHVEKVMKALGQQDPGSLLGAGVKDARALLKEFTAAFTNEARRTVAMCDSMAKRAEKLCDTWIAVKAGVAQSVTNEQQAMTINAQVEEARTATEAAAVALSDINPEAQDHLKKAETAFTRFWKLAIMPPEACAESMLSQTNELLKVENEYGRDWQQEALEFTKAFRAKFPMWAQAYEQQAQADTNKPPFTKEAQAEIASLATEAEKKQLLCLEKELPPEQLDVIKKFERIRELMPKDSNGGGGGQPPPDQKPQQDPQQDQQKKDQQPDQQKNQEQPEENPPEQKEPKQQQADQPKTDQDVEELLRKAQERADEHEADKKARARQAAPSPNERDW
jgi:hypothetical protein